VRWSLWAGLVAPCCLAAACGSTGPGTGSLSGKSPGEVLALATKAATADGFSFHFVDESRVGSKTTTLIGDDTKAGADQALSGSGSPLEVERTADGNLYVRGAADALEGALGLSATIAGAHAGAWISLQKADAPYSAVAATLEPQKEFDPFVPASPLHLEAPRQFHGRTVVGVSGSAPPSAGGSGNVATLYVPTEPPYAPVGATLTFGTGTNRGNEAVVFGRWGQPFAPPAPTGALPFSSLTG
jgi:hypothetical protein